MKFKLMNLSFQVIDSLIKIPLFLSVYNYFFERIPFRYVRYLAKGIHLPDRDFRWRILLRNGRTIVTKVSKGDFKTKKFAISYRWHDPSLTYLEYEIAKYLKGRKGGVWVDCGANLGLRSLIAMGMDIPAILIEPNEEVNRLNMERCSMNGLKNFHILPYGVSDSDGKKTFYIDKSSFLSSLSQNEFKNHHLEREEVIEIRKLDTLLYDKMKATHSEAFVKIDVEGHEWEVLQGGRQIISDIAPTFLIEINRKGEHIARIIEYMGQYGYHVFETIKRDATERRFIRRLPENLAQHTFRSNDFVFVKDRDMERFLEQFVA